MSLAERLADEGMGWTGLLIHQTEPGAQQAGYGTFGHEALYGNGLRLLDHVVPPLPNCHFSFVAFTLGLGNRQTQALPLPSALHARQVLQQYKSRGEILQSALDKGARLTVSANHHISAADLKSLHHVLQTRVRDFKSISGTRIIWLLVLLMFPKFA